MTAFPGGLSVLLANEPWQTVAVTIASLVIAALSFVYANRASAEARRVEAEKAAEAAIAERARVDADAYNRAKELYESGIDSLQDENRRLKDYVDGLKHVYDAELTLTARLRMNNDRMTRQLEWFRQAMIEAGLQPPDLPGGP